MINLTLLVQIVHFWIAYLILDRLVLRFAIQLVRREQQHVAHIKNQITATTAELVEQQQEKERAWLLMHQTLLQQRPPVQPVASVAAKPFVTQPPELSAHDVAQLARQFKDTIIDRITHAR